MSNFILKLIHLYRILFTRLRHRRVLICTLKIYLQTLHFCAPLAILIRNLSEYT